MKPPRTDTGKAGSVPGSRDSGAGRLRSAARDHRYRPYKSRLWWFHFTCTPRLDPGRPSCDSNPPSSVFVVYCYGLISTLILTWQFVTSVRRPREWLDKDSWFSPVLTFYVEQFIRCSMEQYCLNVYVKLIKTTGKRTITVKHYDFIC